MWKIWLLAFHFFWMPEEIKDKLLPIKEDHVANTQQTTDFQQAEIRAIKNLLENKAFALDPVVIDKVLITLQCANENEFKYDNIITIIDYSLPSSHKRLWVFDLNAKKLLFHTYVTHGLNSGTLFSSYFSNKVNSKASSIGIYNTEKSYQGRHGLSLRLDGLDKGFNDNAQSRAIVMHGSWYAEENFIKKYGRAGRSWGCPAVPLRLVKPIIDTIKENSLLVAYHPDEQWTKQSKFLHCVPVHHDNAFHSNSKKTWTEAVLREGILFADLNNNGRREENEPIIGITAEQYQQLFHIKVPLQRMLRRQINGTEYIALTDKEIKTFENKQQEILNSVNFIIPEIKMLRGYYATEMKIISFGTIKEIKYPLKYGIIDFNEKSPIHLRTTNKFVRWIGL
ncbi:MAG: hypothetical protein A3F10_03715 [Coxiella sp. RIFCSPHIGHO2_12_FULL_42_15]|nr:MAG: hypothetical protein A3F10_03715 [Coxiella sp. RIFCSPHIGHO2_12_FULL_42_15]